MLCFSFIFCRSWGITEASLKHISGKYCSSNYSADVPCACICHGFAFADMVSADDTHNVSMYETVYIVN